MHVPHSFLSFPFSPFLSPPPPPPRLFLGGGLGPRAESTPALVPFPTHFCSTPHSVVAECASVGVVPLHPPHTHNRRGVRADGSSPACPRGVRAGVNNGSLLHS